MAEKLTKLYNTLSQIETKGESTKLMALCFNYLQGLIQEESSKEAMLKKVPSEGSEAT